MQFAWNDADQPTRWHERLRVYSGLNDAFNSYDNNAPYWPYYPNGVTNANSNSFVTGLIKAARGTFQTDIDSGGGYFNWAPGATSPMSIPFKGNGIVHPPVGGALVGW